MKLVLLLLRANASKLVLGVLVSIVSGASSAGLVALVHHVWTEEAFTSTFWILSFVGLLLVMIASGVAAQMIVLQLALKAIADLRMRLCAKMLSTPLRRLEKLGPPRLLAVLTDDVTTVSRVLPNVPRIVIDVTTLLACTLYMAWLSWTAVLVILGLGVLGIAAYRLIIRRSMLHFRRGRDEYDTLFGHFRGLHEGIKQLKLNRSRRRVFLSEDLHGSLESVLRSHLVGRTLIIAAENLTRLLFFVVLGIIVFAIPRLGMQAEVLTGFILMALYMYRPLGSLMMLVPAFSQTAVSLQKIDDLGLSLESSPPDAADQPLTAPTWQRLELSGATYTYDREHGDTAFTMGPIDLVFHPGELVFVVGGNGSGKTTFAKVLTSLYPLDRGELRLDGELVSDANRERYRQLFSVVFQDFHLFPKLLGTRDSDLDEHAAEYLKRLQMDHKVQVKDGYLSTTDLSQGQRKRLALLAAYLEDRPFYVFDEWAADQDPQFKDIFYTRVLPELRDRGKTVLVITHDDRYVHVADRCVKLEDGKLLRDAVLESTGKP